MESAAVMLLGWESRELGIVLPIEDVRTMCERARRFDVESGGRFDLRNGRTIVLWSTEAHLDGGRALPIGVIRLCWREPGAGHAIVRRIGWDAALGDHGGAEVWRALDLLSAGAVARPES